MGCPVLLLICDGMGDRATKGVTPLQAASTPNMDRLASEGSSGLLSPISLGVPPGSDTSHLAILGYDPRVYYHGRGPLEALGAGIPLEEGDIALRANFAIVDDENRVVDRRAGRLPEGGKALSQALDGLTIGDTQVLFRHTVGHRAVLILRGQNLSHRVTDSDPHENRPLKRVEPICDDFESRRTADIINKFISESKNILEKHPVNLERERRGLPPVNIVLTRGCGVYVKVPPIRERFGVKAVCVAGGALYKGIAKYLGMEVVEVDGATGDKTTNLSAKIDAAVKHLNSYDLVFLHIKATDDFGHDRDFLGKKRFIEKIDRAITPLLEEDVYIIVTADHSTPVTVGRHSGDPTPFLLWGPDVRRDSPQRFDEVSCAGGALGHLLGRDVMSIILDCLDLAPLHGA
ncbi:MAG: 2,3-bisphosphoglycerate-independent phosphoglycerate mutase [Methanobacteriota archaeon]|nr:MAG: 2,3-bisphosphoglycerate-independent phosphoglycerate mutase [Euryarchaeota archaeon]